MKLGQTIASIRNIVAASAIGLMSFGAYAMDQQQAVDSAEELQSTAADLASRVQAECGCVNTARVLGDIASLAVDAEMEARFGTEASTASVLKKIVRKVKELKQYVQHIHDLNLKLEIKKEIGLTANQLGVAVKGTAWIPCKTYTFTADASAAVCPAPSAPEDLFDRIADRSDD